MNIIRCILICCYLISALFILSACTEKPSEKTNEISPVLQFENKEEKEIEGISYLLRLENETLTFYEVTASEERVIKAININKNYYPMSDIVKLEEGISIQSLSEGFGMLENFSN